MTNATFSGGLSFDKLDSNSMCPVYGLDKYYGAHKP